MGYSFIHPAFEVLPHQTQNAADFLALGFLGYLITLFMPELVGCAARQGLKQASLCACHEGLWKYPCGLHSAPKQQDAKIS